MPHSFVFTSHNAEQTAQLGNWLGQLLEGRETLCLSGQLGAGKTALTAGIGQGWGALEPVTSPTFVIVHDHRRFMDARHLYHLDCYRLETEADAATIGLEDILSGEDSVVIEWPERIRTLLPKEVLWVDLEIDENDKRLFTFRSGGKRYDALLDDLRRQAFGS